MHYSTFILALAASASAQNSTCIIRHLTGAASYLQSLETELPKNFDQNINQIVPLATQFLAQQFPSATALGQVISSIAAAAPTLLPKLLDLVPSGALDPVELAVASAQASAIGAAVAGSIDGLLAAFPPNLAVTDLSSFVSANRAQVSQGFVGGIQQAFPQVIAALTSLESVAYPSGIPADTPGAPPQCTFGTPAAGAASTTSAVAVTTTTSSVSVATSTKPTTSMPSIVTGGASGLGGSVGLVGGVAVAGGIAIVAALL